MAKKIIKPPTTILGVRPTVIESYIKFAEENNLESLNIEEHGLKITIEREKSRQEAPYRIIPTALPSAETPQNQLNLKFSQSAQAEQIPVPAVKEATADTNDKYIKVEAPLVGTFYKSPSPDSPPFVKEGDIVNSGQTLCIVEAMKVMNKINANTKGKIHKIMVEDGQPIKKGDVLFLLDPV